MPALKLAIFAVLLAYLAASAAFDAAYRRINGNLALLLGACVLALSFFCFKAEFAERALSAVGVVAALAAINAVKEGSIGSGDVKALFYLAASLGFRGLLASLAAACAAALLFCLPGMLRAKGFSGRRIAFIPFLAIGSLFGCVAAGPAA